jgi:hypothetical protein
MYSNFDIDSFRNKSVETLTAYEKELAPNFVPYGSTFIDLQTNIDITKVAQKDRAKFVPFFVPTLINSYYKSELLETNINGNALSLPRINSTFSLSGVTITISDDGIKTLDASNTGIVLDICQSNKASNDLINADGHFSWIMVDTNEDPKNILSLYQRTLKPFVCNVTRTSNTSSTLNKIFCNKSIGVLNSITINRIQEIHIPIQMLQSDQSYYHTLGDNNILHTFLVYDNKSPKKDRAISSSTESLDNADQVNTNKYAIDSGQIGNTFDESLPHKGPVYQNICFAHKHTGLSINQFGANYIVSTVKLYAHYSQVATGFLTSKPFYKYLLNDELFRYDNTDNDITSLFKAGNELQSTKDFYRGIRINLYSFPTLFLSTHAGTIESSVRNDMFFQFFGFNLKDAQTNSSKVSIYGLNKTEIDNLINKEVEVSEVSTLLDTSGNPTPLKDKFIPITMIADEMDDKRFMVLMHNADVKWKFSNSTSEGTSLFFSVTNTEPDVVNQELTNSINIEGKTIAIDPKQTYIVNNNLDKTVEKILYDITHAEFKVFDYYFRIAIDIGYIYNSINSTLPTEVANLNSSETQLKLAIAQVIHDRIKERMNANMPFNEDDHKEDDTRFGTIKRKKGGKLLSDRERARQLIKEDGAASDFSREYLLTSRQKKLKQAGGNGLDLGDNPMKDLAISPKGQLQSYLSSKDTWDVTLDSVNGSMVTFIIQRQKTK